MYHSCVWLQYNNVGICCDIRSSFLFYLWLYFKTRKEEPSKAEQLLTKKKKSAKERHEEKKELKEKYINFIKEIEDDDFDYGDEDDE